MKKSIAFLIIGLVTAGVAHAQQVQSPAEEACRGILAQEMETKQQYGTALVTVGRQLNASQVRVKELEDKYEPKKAPEAAKPPAK